MSSQLCLLRRMSGTCLLACMMLSLIFRYYRILRELQGFDAFVLCIYALCIYEKEMSQSVKLDLVPFFLATVTKIALGTACVL